jgi:hypothetical protein
MNLISIQQPSVIWLPQLEMSKMRAESGPSALIAFLREIHAIQQAQLTHWGTGDQ